MSQSHCQNASTVQLLNPAFFLQILVTTGGRLQVWQLRKICSQMNPNLARHKSKVLIFCIEFRKLSHLTRDLSQAEKKITVAYPFSVPGSFVCCCQPICIKLLDKIQTICSHTIACACFFFFLNCLIQLKKAWYIFFEALLRNNLMCQIIQLYVRQMTMLMCRGRSGGACLDIYHVINFFTSLKMSLSFLIGK